MHPNPPVCKDQQQARGRDIGLYVDIVKAILLTQLEVFQNRMICAETIAAFIKTDFHGETPFLIYNNKIPILRKIERTD